MKFVEIFIMTKRKSPLCQWSPHRNSLKLVYFVQQQQHPFLLLLFIVLSFACVRSTSLTSIPKCRCVTECALCMCSIVLVDIISMHHDYYIFLHSSQHPNSSIRSYSCVCVCVCVRSVQDIFIHTFSCTCNTHIGPL